MVLDKNNYAISQTYGADGDSIFEIFKLLKALKILIKKS